MGKNLVDLDNLHDFLIKKLHSHGGCDHTLRWTEKFAKKRGLSFEKLVEDFRATCGHCDCEVLLNVCLGDEDHRE